MRSYFNFGIAAIIFCLLQLHTTAQTAFGYQVDAGSDTLLCTGSTHTLKGSYDSWPIDSVRYDTVVAQLNSTLIPNVAVPGALSYIEFLQPNATLKEIWINISHGSANELSIYLQDPCGREIKLSEKHGNDHDPDYGMTCFDDNAFVPINYGTGPFGGCYIPDEPLATLDNCNQGGSWRLRIKDDVNATQGVAYSGILHNWLMLFEVTPVPTVQWIPATGLSNPHVLNPTFTCNYPGTYQYVLSVSNDSITVTDSVRLEVQDGCVWPGDVNNNGVVNMEDLLPLGIAYNAFGYGRPSASTAWAPQPCNNWSNPFGGSAASVNNFKYADCNGDAKVDFQDVYAIANNYHSIRYKGSGNSYKKGAPALKIDFESDSIANGDTLVGKIYLGDFTKPVQDVYGLSFRINYDKDLIDSTSISFQSKSSFFGTESSDMIMLAKDDYQNSHVDVGVTRINQANASGHGLILHMIVVIDNLSGKRNKAIASLKFSISNITMIDVFENKLDLNAGSDSIIVVDQLNRTPDPKIKTAPFKLFPNPTKGLLYIQLANNTTARQVQLFNNQGKAVAVPTLNSNNAQMQLDLGAMAPGMYILQVQTDEGVFSEKVAVMH